MRNAQPELVAVAFFVADTGESPAGVDSGVSVSGLVGRCGLMPKTWSHNCRQI